MWRRKCPLRPHRPQLPRRHPGETFVESPTATKHLTFPFAPARAPERGKTCAPRGPVVIVAKHSTRVPKRAKPASPRSPPDCLRCPRRDPKAHGQSRPLQPLGRAQNTLWGPKADMSCMPLDSSLFGRSGWRLGRGYFGNLVRVASPDANPRNASLGLETSRRCEKFFTYAHQPATNPYVFYNFGLARGLHS